jgi:hypothetical protein
MAAIVKYLSAGFEGYFMCRLATDPDPNNEPRGRSGYTMALTRERPLDQVIRLQPDDYVRDHLRRPGPQIERHVGVTVRSVTFDGKPWKGVHPLVGADVSLQGTDEIFPGPIFESRNNIVGSDDSMAFVVNPFELAIDCPPGPNSVSLRAVDHLNPAKKKQQIWEIDNPALYGRRFPTKFAAVSPEVQRAISVFDGYAYFRGRRAFLEEEIARLESGQAPLAAPDMDPATFELEIQEATTRLYQLEFWGDRVINKLGFRLEWEFDVNGRQTIVPEGAAAVEALGGRIDTDQPWHVRFWFGGWDGDLLIGYMRGAISMPFRPSPP